MDSVKLRGVDVVHDIDKFPYPFKDNTFSEVLCYSILEHSSDFISVLRELHRICKPGAIIRVAVPFWNSTAAWADPTHRRGFTLDTFTYFQKTGSPKGDRSYYFDFHFRVVRQRLIGTVIGRLLPEFLRRKLSTFICGIGGGITAELEVAK